MAKQRNVDLSTPVIEMRGIVKKFGDFTANDGIDLTVHKGEIHAILGENGAGKSTLMNILYGLYRPTAGEIRVNGQPVEIDSPKKAIEVGIGMVHQHFMLVQPFTITENIVLGMEPVKGVKLDMETARKNVVAISEKYGLAIDPDAKVEDISVGMQQRVEILKALYRGADILILDEPTASLTPQEIQALIEIMHKLTADGKSIILITHKLKEIKASADFCTIIRMGKFIDVLDVEKTTENELAAKMVGRNVTFKVEKEEHDFGDVVLEVEDLRGVDYRKVEILKGLNLKVREGEILGIAGIDGNGQTELVEIITGLRKATSGKVSMRGENLINASPRKLFNKGVTSIPADRQKHGLVLDFTVAENLILQNYREPQFSKNGFLKQDAIRAFAEECVEKYDVRPRDSVVKPAGTLSGGNQQKVIIARWLMKNVDIFIFDEPTRGIDVGAKSEIYTLMDELVKQGKSIIMISSELPEVLRMSDRILVMCEGRKTGELDISEATQENIMQLATMREEN